jgi:phosphoglycolate phosphatase
MKYGAVIFDLDGTLLDTLDDLADSMNAVLVRERFPAHSTAAYRYFVGDGMEMLARRALQRPTGEDDLVRRCMEGMEQEYSRRWNNNTRPYPGVPEMLDALVQRGAPMAVFSNKPDQLTQLTVRELLPHWRFHPVRGARAGFPRKPSPLGALEIAAALQVAPENVAYVGDTNTDMRTATAAGMFAVGAAWGFRPAGELQDHGAARVIAHPTELLAQLS